MDKPSDPGHISLNVGPRRKKALRKLMVELEFDDMTSLLIHLADESLKKHLPAEYAAVLESDPKARTERQGK